MDVSQFWCSNRVATPIVDQESFIFIKAQLSMLVVGIYIELVKLI